VAEVAALPEFRSHDVLVNVQGDEPFVAAEAVRGAIRMVREERFPLGSAACFAPAAVLSDPNVVKVTCADDGRALYFSRAPIPFLRDTDDAELLQANVRQHLGIYVYERGALAEWVALPVHPLEQLERLEQLRPLAAGLAIGVATVQEPPTGGIDTETDLTRANAHWDAFYAGRS
jgi:3-deoxy-manno-octulosonate cytidylyltransferase (CMP-KDO synthetase)